MKNEDWEADVLGHIKYKLTYLVKTGDVERQAIYRELLKEVERLQKEAANE